MIEIRTQSEFDAVVSNTPTSQMIKIYPTETNQPYNLNTFWNLQSNTHIVGVGKPKIQFTGEGIEGADTAMIQIKGTSSSQKENIIIRNLELIGKLETLGSFYGIIADYCGLSYSAGLTTGTHLRYDSATVGSGFANKIGVLIEDCVIHSFKNSGITFSFSHNSKIQNNIIKDTNTNGFYSYRSNCNSISGNTFMRTASTGCLISEGSNNIITYNSTSNSSYGIMIWTGENNIIVNNSIFKTWTAGIYLRDNGNSNILLNNGMYECSTGIYSYSSNNNLISNQTLANNPTGTKLESSSYSLFSASNTISSTEAINFTSSNNMIFSQNTFPDTSPINISSSTNIISYSNNYKNITSTNSTVTSNSNIQRT